MIDKLKNLTDTELTFDKLVLSASDELELEWQKTKLTYVAFSAILNAFLAGKIDFLNKKGKSQKKTKKYSYYDRDKKGKKIKKSKEVSVSIQQMNDQFNEMMNSYL